MVTDHDFVVVQDLNIKNMTRRVESRPDPDAAGRFLLNGQEPKSGLNRSTGDAGWVAFVDIPTVKADEAGRQVIGVDTRQTSDRCVAYGHTAKENHVSQAVLRCISRKQQAHGGEHAARNILRAGLALLAGEKADAV